MLLRTLLVFLVVGLLPAVAEADDRLVRLYAPGDLIETGVLRYALPRFTLKTQVRVDIVDRPTAAEVSLGSEGRALFEGIGQVWHMALRDPDHPGAKRFAVWLTSEVGQRTVLAFAPEGEALFTLAPAEDEAATVSEISGDAVLGRQVSRTKCIRCHAVDDTTHLAGIGSTPSFAVLRGLPDWERRFSVFYVLNPHPSFTVIDDLTPPFPLDRPPPIVPVTLTLDELDALLAFVAGMKAADLGAPLVHQ